MSYQIPHGQIRVPIKATAAYPASDGPRFGSIVNNNGEPYFTRNSSAGARCDGVFDGDARAAGDHGSLIVAGATTVIAGAAIVPGAQVQADAAGKAITAASADVVVAKCLHGAGGDGEECTVILTGTQGNTV